MLRILFGCNLFVVTPFTLRIRNTCIDKSVCDSAKQTVRVTFTTVTKAFMVLIIKKAVRIKQETLSGCGCKSGKILSTARLPRPRHTAIIALLQNALVCSL